MLNIRVSMLHGRPYLWHCLTFWSFSISQLVECPPEGVAYLPLPDCTKYIICANGNPSEFKCPEGLYYNDITKNCDLPENVPDCIGGWRTTLTECGQTLLANSGIIEYKLNQTYEAGEICTFILRHNYSRNSKFRFVLESHGISGFDPNALIITTFGYYGGGGGSVYSMTPTGYLGPPNIIPVVEVTGFVAVVIFKTYSNLGTGFKLSYNVTNDSYGSPDIIGGLDMVFKDELASPISDSELTSCSEDGCADMFVFTSSAKLVVDPNYIFKLTMSSNAEGSESAGETCYEVLDFQYDAFDERGYHGRYCAFNNTENKPETKVYVTRGIFVVSTTNRWRGSQNVTIKWEKSLDPDN